MTLKTTTLRLAIAPLAASVAIAFAPAASADVNCTKVASPGDSVNDLVRSLSAGETGCLRGGTYIEDVTVRNGGAAGAPITITSYPGERAKLIGRLWITRDGDNVTFSDLDLNGTTERGSNPNNYPSPTVNGSNVTFTGNDVTNDHHAICFVVGGDAYGRATKTLIEGNRIHNCGVLPAKNHDHGIYVQGSEDVEILNNVIYDNADRGIQFYPSAQRTHVAGNVIDGNGQGVLFSGDGGQVSNDNVVEDNIITNSKIRWNVESYYPAGNPIGRGNVVRNNCIGGGVRDSGNGGIADEWGFKVGVGNEIVRSPKFVDRGKKDFRLASDSPCRGFANGATKSGGTRGGSTPTPPVTPPVTPPSNPNPGTPTPTSGGPKVTVKATGSRRGVVRVRGRVIRGTGIRSAGATPVRAVIQIRWAGAWYPLKSVRLAGGRFDSKLRLPATLQGRVLTLRVTVPGVAKSRWIRVRAGR